MGCAPCRVHFHWSSKGKVRRWAGLVWMCHQLRWAIAAGNRCWSTPQWPWLTLNFTAEGPRANRYINTLNKDEERTYIIVLPHFLTKQLHLNQSAGHLWFLVLKLKDIFFILEFNLLHIILLVSARCGKISVS